jgi:hypothetical protein
VAAESQLLESITKSVKQPGSHASIPHAIPRRKFPFFTAFKVGNRGNPLNAPMHLHEAPSLSSTNSDILLLSWLTGLLCRDTALDWISKSSSKALMLLAFALRH